MTHLWGTITADEDIGQQASLMFCWLLTANVWSDDGEEVMQTVFPHHHELIHPPLWKPRLEDE